MSCQKKKSIYQQTIPDIFHSKVCCHAIQKAAVINSYGYLGSGKEFLIHTHTINCVPEVGDNFCVSAWISGCLSGCLPACLPLSALVCKIDNFSMKNHSVHRQQCKCQCKYRRTERLTEKFPIAISSYGRNFIS